MTSKPALALSLLTSATRLAVQLFMLAVAYPSVSLCYSQPTSTALLATGTHFFTLRWLSRLKPVPAQ